VSDGSGSEGAFAVVGRLRGGEIYDAVPDGALDRDRDMRAEALLVGRERSLEIGTFAAPQPILAGLVKGDRMPLNVER
jgi:hypothetical protein